MEFVRRNDRVWAGLTTPQIESIVLMLIGGAWIAIASRRRLVFAEPRSTTA